MSQHPTNHRSRSCSIKRSHSKTEDMCSNQNKKPQNAHENQISNSEKSKLYKEESYQFMSSQRKSQMQRDHVINTEELAIKQNERNFIRPAVIMLSQIKSHILDNPDLLAPRVHSNTFDIIGDLKISDNEEKDEQQFISDKEWINRLIQDRQNDSKEISDSENTTSSSDSEGEKDEHQQVKKANKKKYYALQEFIKEYPRCFTNSRRGNHIIEEVHFIDFVSKPWQIKERKVTHIFLDLLVDFLYEIVLLNSRIETISFDVKTGTFVGKTLEISTQYDWSEEFNDMNSKAYYYTELIKQVFHGTVIKPSRGDIILKINHISKSYLYFHLVFFKMHKPSLNILWNSNAIPFITDEEVVEFFKCDGNYIEAKLENSKTHILLLKKPEFQLVYCENGYLNLSSLIEKEFLTLVFQYLTKDIVQNEDYKPLLTKFLAHCLVFKIHEGFHLKKKEIFLKEFVLWNYVCTRLRSRFISRLRAF